MRLIEVNVLKEWVENWFTKNRAYHPYAKNNNIPITELYDILEQMPTAQQWIPIKMRPMDAEEREYWEDHFGYELADEDAVLFDCQMPDDGQEILVSYRKWISMDKCEVGDGCYELEGNGDWDGVIAWMPIPEPYKEDKNGTGSL